MKMNKKSRTLLNLAIAASLFAFAACSDYLQDFQDKYDDGDAFAEISSDSDNGDDDGSSDSKLSSSNGGDSELSSSSDDSELSSSSKGDIESSDSTDSSSSAADPGSSSSVAESSSSAFEPCTGTVIYDAEEDPEFNRFGRKFITYDQVYGSDSSKISSDGVTAYLSHGGSLTMPLAASPNTMNIGPWGGFCVEYTGSGVLHADIYRSIEDTTTLLYKEMPNTNSEKSSFRWSWDENKILMEEQKNSGLLNGFSLEKVNSINFTSYSGNSSITIRKITTLNPNVSIDENLKCDGSEIFPTGRIFQTFTIWSSTGQEVGKINPFNNKYEITLSEGNFATPDNGDAFLSKLANARGFCMEYSSDNYFMLSLNQYEKSNKRTNNYAEREVGKGNQRVVFVLWDELKEQFTNFDFPKNHVLELSAPENGVDATNITISRMTLLD